MVQPLSTELDWEDAWLSQLWLRMVSHFSTLWLNSLGFTEEHAILEQLQDGTDNVDSSHRCVASSWSDGGKNFLQLNFTCFDFVQELQQDMAVGAGHCQELASLGLINLVCLERGCKYQFKILQFLKGLSCNLV